MTVLPIATVGNPGLRIRAAEVTREELASAAVQSFIDDLVETMRHANGAGLAATQVLRHQRICAVEVANNPRYPYKPPIPLTILVNPVLTPLDDELFRNFEGCLSVPGIRGEVDRSTRIRVQAWDRHGNEIDEEVRGLKAATYQHEVDHLDGLLFLDRVQDPRSLATWDSFNEFHKEAFVERVTALVAKHGS
ncbi:MAG: peptide deformylase [Actinobacteria bacterium]|nr:peptide deformylase [Actinomycetota bacterium]